MLNLCAKQRTEDNPYEVWRSRNNWEWRVLKKWQVDDDKPNARWFCFVTSPFCPEGELGDVYVAEIKAQARRVNTEGGRVSYKVEVHVQGEWVANAMRYATKEQAEQAGEELLSRWMLPTAYRVVESNEPVNHKEV